MKQRPALVVSSDAFNASHNDIVVVAITSQVPITPSADEYAIQQNVLPSCGLPKASIIKLSKIVTLHQRLIIKKIGSMPQTILSLILAQIRSQF
jgi:mRNA-degrading endonuclease toxin of MazEF toxin-antitoxin module